MTAEIQNKLFSILRAGMDLETKAISIFAEDCSELKRVGIQQSVLPILLRGLEKTGAPESIIKEFDQASLMDMHQIVQHDIALEDIGNVLDDAKIPYIFLKGADLRNLYPDPNLRTSSDIDVLVHEEDLGKAVESIEAYMKSSRVFLELHFSIRENMENIDRMLARVWEFAKPTGNGTRYELTPEFQIVYIIAHMSYHILSGGIGIRMFLDLWLLRTKTAYDKSVVDQMCAECGILKFYQICSDLTDVWMEDKAHTETTRMLEAFCLSGGVFGNAENAAAARRRGTSAAGHLFSRLFVSRHFLENEYPELKGKPYLLPYYQMKRWIRLLDRQKRQNALSEFRNTRNIHTDRIESFDQMMKQLGL